MKREEKNEKNRYLELADFLKTRRKKILPSQVGLPEGTRRRTPGLRREEVAQLAGLSVAWYTWMEQGREIHVSEQVLNSISKALLLNSEERCHLYLLANQPAPKDVYTYQEHITPTLQHVLDSLHYSPALITDQRWNVIAWNQAACALYGDFTELSLRERNIVWMMFTDERYRKMYVEWENYAKDLIAKFRANCGTYVEDAWLIQFIEELKKQSAQFADWWSLHELQSDNLICKEIEYPGVGRMKFEVSNFEIADYSGLKMVIHTPMPKTDTVDKIKKLMKEK